jgi:DNA polymerase I
MRSVQLSLFTETPTWRPLPLSSLPDLSGEKIIGFDTETSDPGLLDYGPGFIRGTAYVLGVSIAVPGFKTYIPFKHYTGNVEDQPNYIRWLNHCFSGAGTKLAANIHYDLDALKTIGVSVKGRLYDVQVIDALIDDTHDSYSLESIAQRRLQKGKSNEALLLALSDHRCSMSDLDMLHPGQVSEYACEDAALLIEIYRSQSREIEELDLGRALERECKLTEVLWRMHQQGVRIDLDKANQISTDLTKRATDWLDEANRLSGLRIHPTKTKSVAYVLRERGYYVPQTAKDNDSISNDYLKSINDPVIQAVYQWRRLNKIRKDFIDGLFLKYNVNGRIHPQWFQSRNTKEGSDAASGAATGRITGSKPNLTQIPSRDKELGPMCRQLVLPEQGALYCKGDFSSQEPRWVLHYAYLRKLAGATEIRQRYLDDKTTDFHSITRDMVEELTGVVLTRRDAKTINLGVTYAMGEPKLADDLGISREAAKSLLRTYHGALPFLKGISEEMTARIHEVGYIRTWGGRIRRFTKWESATWGDPGLYNSREEALQHYTNVVRAKAHKALNSAVQGTAADQMKQAIIDLDGEGMLPLLQVYDECGLSVSSEQQGYRMCEIMENALPGEVPALVEPAFGPNWGDCK